MESPQARRASDRSKTTTTAYAYEDYLEIIYALIRKKGYARTIDIAEELRVRPPSVTSMVEKLHDEGLLIHEKYRGITLTQKGRRLAKVIGLRHRTLVKFLVMLGVDLETALADSEGIEHHVHAQTMKLIDKFVRFAEANPDWRNRFLKA